MGHEMTSAPLSPLVVTLTKNAPASLLESTFTKSLHLKSFTINSYKKIGVGGCNSTAQQKNLIPGGP